IDASKAEGIRTIVDAASEGPLVLYFALPPAVTASACAAIDPSDLPAGTMLALEKPFGTDEQSARELNDTLRRLVPESQIFRVDHFLGRSTVLNVIGSRTANRIFEPIWSHRDIESISIRYDESLGLEGRAGDYHGAGAIVAMEPPATLDEIDLRDATAAVLRATHVWKDDPAASSRRARYTAGTVGERRMPSYVDEPGVDASRGTETLAEIVCEVRTARW